MAILTVGPTSTFPTIADAVAAAGTGDIISLEAGYGNEDATVTVDGLSFDGGPTSTSINLQLATGISSITLLGTAPIKVIDAADANSVVGNDGDNIITVSNGADSVTGGNGTDRLSIDYSAATASITGTTVNVTDGGTHAVTFSEVENFSISTGSGNDTITVADGSNVLSMGAGDDTITAGDGTNLIDGGANNDTITAGSGANTILGGSGNDTIIASDGGNSVDGGDGDDGISTGTGDDVVFAGLGNDTILTSAGADVTTVNGGVDTVDSGSESDRLIVNFSSSITAVNGGVTGGTLAGGYDGAFADVAGTSSVVFQGTENFTVTTGSANDVIATGDGDDVLDGGAGSDQLNSGGGSDTLLIGLGSDALDGGAGTDAVIFSAARGNYQVNDLGGGVIQIIDLRVNSPDGTDTLVNMEGFFFTDGTFDAVTVLSPPALTVGPNSNYATIAAAMAAGSAGETVTLESGYHNETATITHTGMTVTGGNSIGINLQMGTGIATATLAGSASINLTGGASANTLTGNTGANVLDGGGGDDILHGAGGSDTVTFSGNRSDYIASHGPASTIVIADQRGGAPDGEDTVDGVEFFKFADGTYAAAQLFAATLTVGPNSTYATIADAMAVAVTGDAISIEAGYSGEFTSVTVSGLSFNADPTSLNIEFVLDAGIAAITLLGGASFLVWDNAGSNTIVGNGGGDTFVVSGGLDTVGGGGGIDWLIVDYRLATTDVIGTTTDVSDGGTRTVDFTGIEALTILTGSGNDTITLGDTTNTIETGTGNDTISGGDGNNGIFAGEGNDTIVAGDGGNTIFAGGGDDAITTGTGNDGIDSGLGNDTILTSAGADVTTVNGGIDTLDSGSESDRVIVNFSSSTTAVYGGVTGGSLAGGYDGAFADVAGTSSVVFQGTENFTVTTGSANDVIATGDGDDVLDGGAGSDQLNSGGGSDTLLIGLGSDALDGGAGTDVVIFSAARGNYQVNDLGGGVIQIIDLRVNSPDGTDTLVNMEGFFFTDGTFDAVTVLSPPALTVGPNSNYATIAAAMAAGSAGKTVTLESGYQNETATVTHTGMTITGGSNSTGINLQMGAGVATATLSGSASINLTGGASANTLTGNTAANVLNGGAGVDSLFGGGGNDTYVLGGDTDRVTDSTGIDTITSLRSRNLANYSNIENLVLAGSADTDGHGDGEANAITGNSGDNILTGGTGADRLLGGAGNDLLVGGGGHDTDRLLGGAGNDTLVGGGGHDTLWGGAGADRFEFNFLYETGTTSTTRDLIADFNHGTDKIDISTLADTSMPANRHFSLAAAEGAGFTGLAGSVRWVQHDQAGTINDVTIISGDVNGDRIADFTIALLGLKTLTTTDFVF